MDWYEYGNVGMKKKKKALERAIQYIYYEHILLSAKYLPVPIFSKYLP